MNTRKYLTVLNLTQIRWTHGKSASPHTRSPQNISKSPLEHPKMTGKRPQITQERPWITPELPQINPWPSQINPFIVILFWWNMLLEHCQRHNGRKDSGPDLGIYLKGIPIKSAQILIKNVEGGKSRNKEALWYDLSGRWNRHPIPCHRVLFWLQTRAELVSHAELWTLRQGDSVRLRKKNILILVVIIICITISSSLSSHKHHHHHHEIIITMDIFEQSQS